MGYVLIFLYIYTFRDTGGQSKQNLSQVFCLGQKLIAESKSQKLHKTSSFFMCTVLFSTQIPIVPICLITREKVSG